MGKYKAGEKIAIEAQICWTGDGQYLLDIGECHVDYKIAESDLCDAAIVPQPAPVAQDWQPQVGERVLVEFTYRTGYTNGLASIETTSQGITFCTQVDGNTIIGPAPVRARFAVGDEVFSVSNMNRCEIITRLDDGAWMCQFVDWVGTTWEDPCQDADLLTLSEARERLAK